MKNRFAALILSFFVVNITGFAYASDDKNNPDIAVSFAIMLADDHPHTIAAKTVMAKKVAEKTGGKFIINVQNNGVLGSDSETVEAASMGTMYMTGPAAATLATIDLNWYILDIPYVFTSAQQAREALDGELGEFLSSSLEKSAGLMCLGFGESGMRALSNNKREIRTVSDLKNMKIRTIENKYHLATFTAMGANPTPMAFSEVYTALQTGQIDGQDNAVSITYTNKFYEVQKYFTRLDHLFNVNCYLVNAEWFHSLPASYQTILRDAVREAVKEQRRLVDANEIKQLEAMQNAGCVVTELNPDEKDAFVKITQSVRDSFVKEYAETGARMIELAKRYRR